MKKIWTMMAVGLLACSTADAQLLTGDDLWLDGAGTVPSIRFQQSDGEDHILRPDKVDVGALLEASSGLDVIGEFEVTGENVPTFTSTVSTPPSLTLQAGTDSEKYNRLTSVGYLARSATGLGYMLYGWDDPITQQLVVRGDKNTDAGVGIGTFFPEASLHVYADGIPYDTAELIVENNIGTVANREMLQLINNGGVRFVLANTDINTVWEFSNNTRGDFLVSLADSGGPEFTLTKAGRFFTGPAGFKAFDARSNGNVWIAGTYNQTSDRTKKENFEDIDPNEVLEKLTDIPVTTWNYKTDEDAVRHMGPMAQDFHAAFELGESDRVIALADMFGVSVTAIKALNKQSKAKDVEIETLMKRIAGQDELIKGQEERLKRLESLLQE